MLTYKINFQKFVFYLSNWSAVIMILIPLFALSGIMAYILIRQIDREEKMKQKRGVCLMCELIVHKLCGDMCVE